MQHGRIESKEILEYSLKELIKIVTITTGNLPRSYNKDECTRM